MVSYRDKKVLIAGATGLVGMALTRRLHEMGARVRATLHRAQPLVRYPGVDYAQADLTLKADCQRVMEEVDILFLVAANTSGAAAIATTPLIHVTPNIILNSLMLEAAYTARVKKVLWLSSTTSYPDAGDRPLREDEMFVGDPPDVYFPVGHMKRYTEVLCRMYSTKLKNPICVQVLRPTNIYGPFDDFRPETSHVLAALIRKVVERQNPIEVWGNGEDVRDLIYVEDMAEACLTILGQSAGYDPVNIGLGQGHSVKEMLKLVCEADGYHDAKIVFDVSKPRMIPKRLVDTAKAQSKYGFAAKTGLQEGIQKTIRWYRENLAMLKK